MTHTSPMSQKIQTLPSFIPLALESGMISLIWNGPEDFSYESKNKS